MSIENLIKANTIVDIQLNLLKMSQDGYIVPDNIMEMLEEMEKGLTITPRLKLTQM
jgi:hypothetical protein